MTIQCETHNTIFCGYLDIFISQAIFECPHQEVPRWSKKPQKTFIHSQSHDASFLVRLRGTN